MDEQKTKTEREKKYSELFDLLSQSELAARNGEWATCASYAKLVTELGFKYSREESKRFCPPSAELVDLLRFARTKIHVRPPGLEDSETTKWALAISRLMPEFAHWNGQSDANRKEKEASWETSK